MMDTEAALQAIRDSALLQELRVSQHAQQEMAEEAIRLAYHHYCLFAASAEVDYTGATEK